MQSLSHMNQTTGVFDKHNVVVQRMINMTREPSLWTVCHVSDSDSQSKTSGFIFISLQEKTIEVQDRIQA